MGSEMCIRDRVDRGCVHVRVRHKISYTPQMPHLRFLIPHFRFSTEEALGVGVRLAGLAEKPSFMSNIASITTTGYTRPAEPRH